MPTPDSVLYALRIGEWAERDIIEAVARFLELEGGEIAVAWESGLYRTMATLSISPGRYPVIPEQDRFSVEVRSIPYRRTKESVMYRLIYTVADASPDGPFVLLLTVRHGASRPITRTDARNVEAQTSQVKNVPRKPSKRKKRTDQ